MVLASLQLYLFLALALVLFGIEAWALIDAARRPTGAFPAEGKRTKTFWVALLAAAAVVGFVAIPPPLGAGFLSGFLQFAAVVPAGVYLADVRPAVRGYRPGRGGGPGGW